MFPVDAAANSTSRLEAVIRVVAGIAVGTYAIGLFTANAYLNRIGVADFAQLRARFAFTGAIVLLAFAVAFVPAREAWRQSGRGRVLAVAWSLVGVAGWFVSVSLTKGGVEEDSGFGRTELRHALLLEIGALLAGAAGGWLSLRFWEARSGANLETPASAEIDESGRAPLTARVTAITASAALLAGAAVFLSQFGRHVYPRIPVSYGGGKAVCGRLLLAKGADAELSRLRLPSPQGRVTKNVPIAYEADEFIVIGQGGDKWLRIREELVEALQIGPQSGTCEPNRTDGRRGD